MTDDLREILSRTTTLSLEELLKGLWQRSSEGKLPGLRSEIRKVDESITEHFAGKLAKQLKKADYASHNGGVGAASEWTLNAEKLFPREAEPEPPVVPTSLSERLTTSRATLVRESREVAARADDYEDAAEIAGRLDNDPARILRVMEILKEHL